MDIFLYYILPVLIFIIIAFAFGFLLEFLGNKLIVERDPRIDEVVSQLAGANCGGCGYPGCDAFAVALVKGEAELSACNPTSKFAKDKIAAIVGTENTGEETVAIVHCNGGKNCESKAYQGYGNCTSANIIAGGNKQCYVGCMCLGTCSDACKYDAIKANTDKGYAEVNAVNCVSCGACISACPKGLISRVPKNAKIYIACSNLNRGKEVSSVCKVGCIGCGICAKVCPESAITIIENLAVIDYKKCTGCYACVAKCPTKVIKYTDKEKAVQ